MKMYGIIMKVENMEEGEEIYEGDAKENKQ